MARKKPKAYADRFKWVGPAADGNDGTCNATDLSPNHNQALQPKK